MAASSMGAFGTYKTQYHRIVQDQMQCKEAGGSVDTVWITKRYNPLDLRVQAPVPRCKLVSGRLPVPAEKHWVPVTDPPLRSFDRRQLGPFASWPNNRDENWSTLRQTLPSVGNVVKVKPPRWGTGQGTPPIVQDKCPKRLPQVNSPMTRYIDEMHSSNKLFKFH